MSDPPRERVIATGDNLETDIAGAVAAGLVPLLVTAGCERLRLGLTGARSHDGYQALPDAVECLARLRERGPVCLLSNSHRRLTLEIDRLTGMGIQVADNDALVTAGEVCRRRLDRDLPDRRGRAFLCLGIEENANLLDDLECRRLETPDDADFVLVGDPALDRQELAAYEADLAACAARGLPLACLNPDWWSYWGESHCIKPGALGDRYVALGGEVLWCGTGRNRWRTPGPGGGRRAEQRHGRRA